MMANSCAIPFRRTKCFDWKGLWVWLWCLMCFQCLLCINSETTQNTLTVFPKGDVLVEEGNDLEIYCTAETNYTSDDIVFTLGGKTLDSEVVNSTTKKLFIRKPPIQQKIYYCQNLKTGLNGINTVFVNSKPRNISDFGCFSKNLEVLNCSWISPDRFITTQYNLTFLVNHEEVKPCQATKIEYSDRRYCAWYSDPPNENDTTPLYRQQEDSFEFILYACNRFGCNNQTFTIDHFSIVRPDKPYNLKVTHKTPHNIELQWEIPNNIRSFLLCGVEHKIEYQIAKVDNTSFFRQVDTSQLPIRKPKYRYNLTGLPYAHMQYEVRIYIKSRKADNSFWSDYSFIVFTTESEKPSRPPDTAVGAFHQAVYADSRIIYVYWKQLEEYEESGANFTYRVLVANGKKTVTHWPDKNKSMSYIKVQADKTEPIEVTIYSYNLFGSSQNSSHLYIPPEANTNSLHINSFTNVGYENGTYDLSWIQSDKIDNYTLFWCKHNSTNICSGRLNFTVLSPDLSRHVIELPKDYRYQFAISANKGSNTTGMVWAQCDISKDALPMFGFPMRLFRTGDLYPTSAEVSWEMDCTLQDGIVIGYNLTYCPITAINNEKCDSTENMKSVYINNPKEMKVNVSGLKPHRTYNFHIALDTIHGLKLIRNATTPITFPEDTPSKPLNILISKITNSTITVSWDPPEFKNGRINRYHVCRIPNPKYNGNHCVDKPVEDSNSSKETITLEQGVHGFTNYSITVQACNDAINSCSKLDPRDNIYVRTAIGAPSQLNPPREISNSGILTWDQPQIPGGTVDMYQIRIQKDNEAPVIIETEHRSHPISHCVGGHSVESYEVRAINYDENIHHGAFVYNMNVNLPERIDGNLRLEYHGNWSNPYTYGCGTNNTLFLMLILLGVFVVIGVGFGVLKGYRLYMSMGNIAPKFPEGVFGPEKDGMKYPLGGLYPSDKDDKPGSDEMLLLPNSKTSVSTPEIKQRDNDNCGSSDHTDSTALSDISQGPIERQNSSSDDGSHASLHLGNTLHKDGDNTAMQNEGETSTSDTESSPENSPYFNSKSNSGYIQPPAPATTGYVQTVASPKTGYVQAVPVIKSTPVIQPASSSYVRASLAPPVFNTGMPGAALSSPPISSGYVRPEDALRPGLTFPKLSPLPTKAFGSESLPPMPTLPPQTKTSSDSSYIQLQSLDTLPSHKPTVRNIVPSKPVASNGYVSPEDAVINKHLRNIMSGPQLSEDPAIVDPAMSPDAYCRLQWSADPANDNLRTLLADPPTINFPKN